jgi:hypothetical protein
VSANRADRNEILAAERAVNERYRTQLKQDLEKISNAVAQHTSLSRNSIWSSGTISAGKHRGEIHPVVGRVALPPADDTVDGELYIGPQIQELDGEVTVVSWAAPVAELFFEGRRSRFPGARHVLGRRTFTTEGTDLTDFVDDVEPDAKAGALFAIGGGRSTIEVPEAPRPTDRPRPRPRPKAKPEPAPESQTRPAPKPLPVPTARPEPKPAALPEPEPAARPEPAPANEPEVEPVVPAAAAPADVGGQGLRAEQAVLEIVERPRTGELTSVLATLQPDQYELVTWPAEKPLIVHGHPGTGKTVVAMHRAGFLTHPERPGGPLGRVVVVGPTDEYRDHVRLVSSAVGGANVPVRGLPSFLARLAQVNVGNLQEGPHDRVGVQWSVWSTVHRAARVMGVAGAGKVEKARSLVKELVTDSSLHRKCVSDTELSAWLLRIGSFQKAESHHDYLPFLATVGLAVMRHDSEHVDHLIVDEAQDVPPLVWQILLSFLRPGGSVSLFGDINQRRSDWTAASWEQLAVDLELTDDDGVAPIRTLSTGFRTTREILKFANQLLPAAERKVNAIRQGSSPVVRRVPFARLAEETLAEADLLSRRHPAGLTAVISRDPEPVSDGFRNAGWRRGRVRDSWETDGRTVFVLHPDRARGLEFDAVVVVEPNAFPKNLGRDGVLYTSLTRATQELAVLYSGKLPKNLRRPR